MENQSCKQIVSYIDFLLSTGVNVIFEGHVQISNSRLVWKENFTIKRHVPTSGRLANSVFRVNIIIILAGWWVSEERVVDVRGILRIYFFLRVKKERRLGSSLEAEAGRVWDLPGPLSPEALLLMLEIHMPISSSSMQWKR